MLIALSTVQGTINQQETDKQDFKSDHSPQSSGTLTPNTRKAKLKPNKEPGTNSGEGTVQKLPSNPVLPLYRTMEDSLLSIDFSLRARRFVFLPQRVKLCRINSSSVLLMLDLRTALAPMLSSSHRDILSDLPEGEVRLTGDK